MTISSIQQAVQDTWRVIFAPVCNLLFVIAIIYILGGVIYVESAIQVFDFSFLIDDFFQKFIGFYEINKITPIFFLFGIIFVLYVIQKTITIIGQLLPIKFGYLPHNALVHNPDIEPERIAAVWKHFPAQNDIYNLYSVIQKTVASAEASYNSQAMEGIVW